MRQAFLSVIMAAVSLIAAPALFGLINRVKALCAGRKGQPLLQPYFDLSRLWRKGIVYSRTVTPLFYLAPLIILAASLTCLLLVPVFPGIPAIVSFSGDFILVGYWLALMRFFIVIAALDTGSSFEAMGANREVFFSTILEPALFIVMTTLVYKSGVDSLSAFFTIAGSNTMLSRPEILLLLLSLFIFLLAENARIPVDDPNTHLELTMIHEVMILDHSGPDLAFLLYASYLKFWIITVLLIQTMISFFPIHADYVPWLWLLSILMIAVSVGIVESTLARFRLSKVPQFLMVASAAALLGYIIAR
jgi:formate hydrogenlyase subunit 4